MRGVASSCHSARKHAIYLTQNEGMFVFYSFPTFEIPCFSIHPLLVILFLNAQTFLKLPPFLRALSRDLMKFSKCAQFFDCLNLTIKAHLIENGDCGICFLTDLTTIMRVV